MSTLKKWLCEYEKSKSISNTRELVEALRELLETEESLPCEKRDLELTEEATEALLALMGEDISEIDKNADALASNIIKQHTAKQKKLKQVLLVAALITLMSALMLSALWVMKQSDRHSLPDIEPKNIINEQTEPGDDTVSDHSNHPSIFDPDFDIGENSADNPDTTNTEETDDTERNTEDNNDDPEPIGGSNICEVHNWGYHSYPREIKEYIGEERFREWSNDAHSTRDEEGCWPNGNILICIEHFDVPDEVIIEAYQNDYYNRDWDMEALLSRDTIAFEASARENQSSGYSEKLSTELILKSMLFDIMETKSDTKTVDYYKAITDNGTFFPYCNVTLYDMVSNTSLTKEDFMIALGNATSNNREDFVTPYFEYDLDLLFGDPSLMTNAINELDVPYYESKVKMSDALLHIDK